MRQITTFAAALLSATCLSGAVSLAFAEEDRVDQSGNDVVIVTAQKREQRLEEVPLSLSAFSSKAIEDSGSVRLGGFADLTPNVFFNPLGSIRNTKLVVRGINSDANSIGVDQTAGVYVDGVYMGRPTTINMGIYDVERIEILRGPQGTIYGKNTISGAINLITKKPGDEFGAEIAAQYGNFNQKLVYAAVEGPIVEDKLSVRLAAQFERRDGFIKNLAGADGNDDNNVNARLIAVYNASDSLQFTLRGDWARDRTNQGAAELFVNSPIFADPPFNVVPGSPLYVPDDGYDFRISEYPASFQDRDVWGGSFDIDWNLGYGALTSVTSYRGFEWNNAQDADKSPFTIFGTGIKEDQDQLSQELRFTSPSGERLEYIVGLYYWKMNLSAAPTVYIGPDILSLPAFGGLPLGSFIFSEGRLLPDLDNESFAAFTHGTFHLSEMLDITAGVRYTHEEKSITFSAEGDALGIVADVAEKSDSFSDDVVSPMASITFKPTDSVHLYATYSRGFKAGGYNAFDFDFENEDGSVPSFAPEYASNYEIGLKYVSPDGGLRASIAAFYLDYTDLQVNQRFENSSGIFYYKTSNAATAISKGVEFEASWQILPQLLLTTAYGYNDATYDDFVSDVLTNTDYSGNRLPYSSKHNFSATAQYDQPLAEGVMLSARGEYVYRGATFSDQANTPLYQNDDYNIVNARLGVSFADPAIELTVWARNLFDERYTRDLFGGSSAFSPGAYGGFIGDPRTYGFELRKKF